MNLNRYIYGRDNPERNADLNGRRYVYTTGVVTNTESVCGAIPSACATIPSPLDTYQNTAFGGWNPYGGSPLSSGVVVPTPKGPAVVDQGGVTLLDTYSTEGSALTITIGQSTQSYVANLVGAYGLALAILALSAEYWSNFELQAEIAITDPFLAASIDMGLVKGDAGVLTYMASHSTDATPDGVLGAFIQGFGAGFTFDVLSLS